uniref:Uncharacterized protein n=1 Tax=Oryza sativa subsp. japonica TaxID=39947 RepID=Q6K948_ORYSJ|nr:hypothetical protein [Oryza sativa Japonica Group]BAD21601.1 hypothetical protein [Oryza sativa Japonica Group]
MVAAGLVAAATLDPARANLRVEAGRSGAVVEAGGVQGARATAAGGRGGDRRRRGAGLAAAAAGGGGGVWAAVVKAAVAESTTSGITGSASTIAGSGARRQREHRRRGSGGGGAWRSVEARPVVWRPARPVEMRPAAWRGGRLGSVESGAAGGVEAGDGAWLCGRRWQRPVQHVEARPAAWMASRASTTGPLAALAGSNAGESLAVPLAGSMTTTPLAPFPFLKALSWRSAICPTNLQVKTLLRPRTSGDDVTRRVLLGGIASGKFLTSMTIDGPFGSKAFFPWHSARPKPLGSASFYDGRHTLRLLLRMKKWLFGGLADVHCGCRSCFRFGDFCGFSVAAVVKSALLGRLGG